MQGVILVLGIISLFMGWYVFQGIKVLTANIQSGRKRKTLYWIYWVVVVGILIGFAFSAYIRFETDTATPTVQWFINAFLTLFVTQLVFILVLFAEDLFRLLKALFRVFPGVGKKSESKKDFLPERRKFVSQVGLVLASLPFASFVYGVTRGKYRFTVHRKILFFEDLPEAFHGFTICQVSDIHSGSLDDPEAVRRGIELVNDQGCDLFVFTGDLVNDHAAEIVPFMDSFSQIKAPYGQFSVLGNHDYGMYVEWKDEAARAVNMENLKKHHATMGWRLLLDENVELEKNGQKIALLGVENWGRGFIEQGDLNKALLGVEEDAFKVLLSHDPSHWQEIVKNHPAHVHLTLSGHTHGMQFGIETPLVKWSPVQYRYEHWAGLAEAYKKMLYVNRGFGFIGFSGRVGIWPEVTVLELRKGKG